jgi:hypothetical protein
MVIHDKSLVSMASGREFPLYYYLFYTEGDLVYLRLKQMLETK